MELIPFVDLKTQYQMLAPEIDTALKRVLESASFIMGPDVANFEEEFAGFCGVRHCIGVASGTAALKLALQAFDIGPGDEVILPANTYIATALAVSQVGATPVLVDIGDDYLIDESLMEAAITPRTKAVILVHLYGLALPKSTFEKARRHNLRIIEDACQAHGAMIDGKRVGAIGDAGCFSFYPGKNLGAYGDGGAIVTNDSEISQRICLLRDFGQSKKYEHLIKGDNSRLDTLQAAVLRVKLRYLDGWNERRRQAAARYAELFTALDVRCAQPAADGRHVYHLYVVELPLRDSAQHLLAAREIQTGIHYPVPIHLQEAYRDLDLGLGSFPKTESASQRLLSLPMFPEISEEQLQRVAAAVQEHLGEVRSSSAARHL